MPENPRARRLPPPTPEYFPTLGKQFYPNNSILFRFDPNNSIIFHFDQNNSILFQLDPNNSILYQCDFNFILNQFDPFISNLIHYIHSIPIWSKPFHYVTIYPNISILFQFNTNIFIVPVTTMSFNYFRRRPGSPKKIRIRQKIRQLPRRLLLLRSKTNCVKNQRWRPLAARTPKVNNLIKIVSLYSIWIQIIWS